MWLQGALKRAHDLAKQWTAPAAPTTWEEFQAQLEEPKFRAGFQLVSDYQRFSQDPAHHEALSRVAVAELGLGSVRIRVTDKDVVAVMTRSLGCGNVLWQSKPDGSTYRGFGFSDVQSLAKTTGINTAVLQCFVDLTQKNPSLEPIIARARASYQHDISVFERSLETPGNIIK